MDDMIPTVRTRSGRQVRFTDKMAQLLEQRQRKDFTGLSPTEMKLRLENEILKTQLEISQTEESIRKLSLDASTIQDAQVTKQKISPLKGKVGQDTQKMPPGYRGYRDANRSAPANLVAGDYAPDPLYSTPKMGYWPDPTDFSVPTWQPPPMWQPWQYPPEWQPQPTADVFSKLALPKLEPEVFGGDILKFPQWIKSFESLIEKNTSSDNDRLYFMSKYTTGSANDCIKGFLVQDNDSAYDDAKKALLTRFGDKYRLSEAFKARLNLWPQIKDGEGLRKLSDFLKQCNGAMESLTYLKCLDNAEENRKIAQKLPKNVVDRWNRVVDRSLYGRGNDPSYEGSYPTFADFCEFIEYEARVACGPLSSSQPAPSTEVKKRNAGAFAAQASSDNTDSASPSKPEKKTRSCIMCEEDHDLASCEKFRALKIEERKSFVKSKGICFKCLYKGHLIRDCRRRGNVLLYIGLPPKNDQAEQKSNTEQEAAAHRTEVSKCQDVENEASVLSQNDSKAEYFHSLIVPVMVYQEEEPHKQLKTYAMLDNQSNSCFISDSLADNLDVCKDPVSLNLTTMLNKETVPSNVVKGLVIRGVNELTHIQLPSTYTRSSIPASETLIPKPETVKQWPHLKDIASQIPPYDDSIEVGLLIGFNCSAALIPKAIKAASDEDPYAVKTNLGWGVTGAIGRSSVDENNHHFTYRTHVKEVSPAMVLQMFEYELTEGIDDTDKMSYEDRKFLKIVNENVKKVDGHFELPLPLKNKEIKMPNNRVLAEKRLAGLRRKMIKDENYKKDYVLFMKNMIDKGFAERVTGDGKDGNTWYIPHHGVYHPKKPGKIRIVFDCSTEHQGHSLNQHLLQGPDYINSLAGVLCRFRKESVAFVCDIEGMFHQVKVTPTDRDFLRFLWYDGSDINKSPIEYRMTVHLFGAVSSPACANFALRQTADMYEGDYGKEAADFIRNDFYVDDGLKSVATPEEARSLMKNARDLCKQGGFSLHKFVCSDKTVLTSIPSESVKTIDLSQDSHVSRTLGVEWSIEDDTFRFKTSMKTTTATRRGILSAISSIFDPLGLISPMLLPGRLILQDICKGGCNWDDPIAEDVAKSWKQWADDLQLVNELQVPRCYKGDLSGEVTSVELHHFADASLTGYGECSYLRLIDEHGGVSTSLVMSKSRVAPTKPMTIPRLELMAAVLAVKVARFLNRELHYDVKHVFWTDSKVVLGYIRNEARRFHMFVANRVHQIRAFSEPSQWNYVNTDSNPADATSRGLTASELVSSEMWWRGPEFLSSAGPLPFPQGHQQPTIDVDDDDPEVRKEKVQVLRTAATEASKKFSLIDRISHISDWNRAKRAVALCLKLKEKMRGHKMKAKVMTRSKDRRCPATSVSELQEAEHLILKSAQEVALSEELRILKTQNGYPSERQEVKKRNQELKKSSNLFRLDPFIDENGLIRVGGRIKRSGFLLEEVHPVILPKSGVVTQLLIAHMHAETCHAGRNTTLNELRASGYWIVKGRTAVSSFIHRCVTCRKLRGSPSVQKMADLPPDRMEVAPPFTHSGVDMFGPFLVKEARSQKKRWGVLFTCMATRAIHIEVANSMTTDAFLNAYRRFVGRRGKVRTLRCDQGTNFVGASNEMKAAMKELDDQKIQRELAKDACDFVEYRFNVPHASHMGGTWERMIRSVRAALAAILLQNGGILDDESLHTFMVEAEMVVNSRPLTFVDSSNGDDAKEALSPSQLLTLKSRVVLPPPGSFVKEDIYSRKRWRRVQFLANQFWCRWRKEYLPMLQERSKWTKTTTDLQVDDIVLVVDEQLPRCNWPYGRIMETYPSEDKHVRKVRVKTATSEYDRPITKLVFLYRPGFPDEEPQ